MDRIEKPQAAGRAKEDGMHYKGEIRVIHEPKGEVIFRKQH